jgi:outer membrane protein assembly factor BamA
VYLKKKLYLLSFFTCFLILCYIQTYAQKDSSLKTHNELILPLVARSIETNWSFGVVGSFTFHVKSDKVPVRTSNMQALVLYTLRHQFVAAINGSIYFPGEKFILNQQLSYSYFPDDFWGLGKVAPYSNKEHYDYKQYYIYLHPQYSVGKNMFVGLLYEYQRLFDVNYLQGGLFDQENIVGRNGYHISGLGLSFTYDTRDNAFSPDKGVLMQFYFDHFAPIFGSDYEYTNYVLDMRKFIRTYKKQVLALQAYGFFNVGEVPLRSLASLGGATSMRGYYDGRYRDKNKIVFQAEYRAPLFWRFGAVVFGDFGNVGSEVSDINFQYLKYTYGAGLRFSLNKAEKLNLRLDYGIGTGAAHGFYLQLGEAF